MLVPASRVVDTPRRARRHARRRGLSRSALVRRRTFARQMRGGWGNAQYERRGRDAVELEGVERGLAGGGHQCGHVVRVGVEGEGVRNARSAVICLRGGRRAKTFRRSSGALEPSLSSKRVTHVFGTAQTGAKTSVRSPMCDACSAPRVPRPIFSRIVRRAVLHDGNHPNHTGKIEADSHRQPWDKKKRRSRKNRDYVACASARVRHASCSVITVSAREWREIFVGSRQTSGQSLDALLPARRTRTPRVSRRRLPSRCLQ